MRLRLPSGSVIVADQQFIIWDVPTDEIILGVTLMEDLRVDPLRVLDQTIRDRATRKFSGGTSGQGQTGSSSMLATSSDQTKNKESNFYSPTERPSDWEQDSSDDDVPIGEDTDEEIWSAMKGMYQRAQRNGLPRQYHSKVWELIVAKRKVWRVKLSKDDPADVEPFLTELKPDAEPVRCPQRNYKLDQSEFMKEFVDILLENGMVKENPNSKWASPAVVVRKPNGSYRMVIDLRKVNERSIRTTWPMPLLEGIIQHLAKSKYWFILDAFKGFWLMPLAKKCQEMMSFMTDRGVYTPTRSIQGATNSAPQFQARMSQMFRELLWKQVIVWMDDILGHAATIEGWFQSLVRVLDIAEERNLKLNAVKCDLFTMKVNFCGKVFTEAGVSNDPAKVEALIRLPHPKTARDLQQFIFGSQWMNRHIPGYASRIYPLVTLYEELMSKMPKRNRRFAAKAPIGNRWMPEHTEAYRDVKQAIANSAELAYPDAAKPKVVIADASDLACAGFVTQIPAEDLLKHPKNMRHQPLGFWGHRFQGSEKNWTMTVKEGYALKGTMAALQYCFIPSKHRTLLVTDHKNLIALADPTKWNKPTSEMLERWIQSMQRIPYDIRHISGEDNYFADIMSRWGYDVPSKASVSRITFQSALDSVSGRVRPLQKDDFAWPDEEVIRQSQLAHFPKAAFSSQKRKRGRMDKKIQSLLHNKNNRIVIPEADALLRARLTIIAHAGERCGHVGQRETLAKLRQRFTWRNMEHDVKELCTQCLHCAPIRGSRCEPRPLGTQVHGKHPGQVVHTDVLYIDQPSREGYSNVMVLYDDFTGLVWLRPAADVDAEFMVDMLARWRAAYGTPEVLVSDQAAYYKNKVVRLFCQKTGLKHHLVVSYTHFSNGTVEVVNSHVLSLLRALMSELRWDRADWPYLLASVEHTLNHRRQASRMNRSPVELMGGRKDDPFRNVVRRPEDDDWKTPPSSEEIQRHCDRLEGSLARLHKDVSSSLEHSRELSRLRASRSSVGSLNQPRFEIGEYVLVAQTDSQFRSTPKPLRRWQGPYRVTDLLSDWVLEVEDLIHRKRMIVHISRVRFYCDKHLHVTSDIVEQYAYDCQKYEVERLLDLRKDQGRLELLVSWKGFEDVDNSWEPASQLIQDVPHLCRDFVVPRPELRDAYTRCLRRYMR
jgi:hypothetical protein